jgi:hypothetical protein
VNRDEGIWTGVCRHLLTIFWLWFTCPDVGGDMFLQNVSSNQKYMAQDPRRRFSCNKWLFVVRAPWNTTLMWHLLRDDMLWIVNWYNMEGINFDLIWGTILIFTYRSSEYIKGKDKAVPVTGHEGSKGCERSRLPHLDSRLIDGGKVVSFTCIQTDYLLKIKWERYPLQCEYTANKQRSKQRFRGTGPTQFRNLTITLQSPFNKLLL